MIKNMKNHTKTRGLRAFTLIEVMIAVAVLAIILGIGSMALRNSKANALARSAEARAKLLNDARDRVIIGGIDGINSIDQWNQRFPSGDQGMSNAAAFVISNNLIQLQAANQ